MVIDRLTRDIGVALGDQLLGLYVHGSYVLGDFNPDRSDVDLLAVLAADPSPDTVAALTALHERLTADRPEWTDRVEVEYASVAALADFRTDPHPMVRISPGEPLHVVPATRHYVLNWYAARERGRVLHGPPARDLIPAITAADWTAAIRDHVRQWPDWVSDMHTPGAQAYAVLTLCRALHALDAGNQVSKPVAATWAAQALPPWADLITWASNEPDRDRLPEVTRFVTDIAARIGVMGIELVRAVRDRLGREGPARTRGPELDFETVTLPERDCDLLRDLLVAEGVGTVVEVGLAYGSSALAIGEALVTVGAARPRHLVIDPFQQEAFAGVGWDLLREAGLDEIATLVAEPSSIALPRLLTDGVVADAAFVDGSHRFHEVFLDLYFLRKIVRPGGLIVLDDDWTPSVRTALRYYERNLGWTAIPDAFITGTHRSLGDDPAAGEVPRCRAIRLPDKPFEPAFEHFQPF